MPPTIFGQATFVLSEAAASKIGRPSRSCAHFGKKLDVKGLKASSENVLYSPPILVASATKVCCADLAYSVVTSKNLSGDFTPASFSKYALLASNDDLANRLGQL